MRVGGRAIAILFRFACEIETEHRTEERKDRRVKESECVKRLLELNLGMRPRIAEFDHKKEPNGKKNAGREIEAHIGGVMPGRS